MALKRKRNLKVDVTAKYSVCLLKSLDGSDLEDYVETHDTGMEADEEKEIQLQSIMKGSGASIPLPIIAQVSNPARSLFSPTKFKCRIKWHKDVPNEYIGDAEEARALAQKLMHTGADQAENKHEDNEVRPAPQNVPGANDVSFNRAAGLFEGTQVEKINGENFKGDSERELGFTGCIDKQEELSSNAGSNEPGILHSVGDAENGGKRAKTSCSAPNIAENGLIEINKISEQFKQGFETFGNTLAAINMRDGRLINYILNRTLLRYEKPGFEAYTCFRRRVFHPSFKSRRNELIMLEKLERMGAEFYALKDMCSAMQQKTEQEIRHLKLTSALVREYHIADLTKRLRRVYKRKILEVAENLPANKVPFNVHSIMQNRDKIAAVRKVQVNGELPLDVGCYRTIMNLLHDAEQETSCPRGGLECKKVCRCCRGSVYSSAMCDNRKHSV